MTKMIHREETAKPDHKPLRSYEDDQGNTVDPKTTWDELLKYYRKYYRLLGVGAHSRQSSSGTSTRINALKLIIAERIHRENKRKAAELESRDLDKKEKQHKKRTRERQADLAADYLDKVHKQHS